eukprot:11191883-Lingulodinium_polyedra.AAC.1
MLVDITICGRDGIGAATMATSSVVGQKWETEQLLVRTAMVVCNRANGNIGITLGECLGTT